MVKPNWMLYNHESLLRNRMSTPTLQPKDNLVKQVVAEIENEIETLGEAIANSITHGLGLVFSIFGMVVLIILAAHQDSTAKIVSSVLYGASLVAMYASSTLYHSFRYPKLRYYLRILDHTSIYLLIAGSYTPFALVSLHGAWGWSLLAANWSLAIFGITFKLIFEQRFHYVSMIIYLVMGWMIVVAIEPIMGALPVAALIWLVAGGVAYTGGIVFYIWEKPYNHTIWHLFVMLGSVCHYIAILLYVIR